ncbi:MAG: transposase, partial [Candidatus Marinimicrobia bacterium]|nr:transposase [Candidatus Neomarinimicrobiota bacterium]
STAFISRLTDRVLQEVKDWQQRPLESVYVIVYFDAIHYKIRSDGKVQTGEPIPVWVLMLRGNGIYWVSGLVRVKEHISGYRC